VATNQPKWTDDVDAATNTTEAERRDELDRKLDAIRDAAPRDYRRNGRHDATDRTPRHTS